MSTKQYNISLVVNGDFKHFSNCKIIEVLPNWIYFRDSKNKEHIYTGKVGICVDEI